MIYCLPMFVSREKASPRLGIRGKTGGRVCYPCDSSGRSRHKLSRWKTPKLGAQHQVLSAPNHQEDTRM